MPLDAFRAVDSYVLLGDPGSGKTRALEKEALESAGLFISARDFLTLEPRDEWKSQTLFIDGLDETRAGDGDKRSALDRVR